MNRTSGRAYFGASAILGGVVLFAAASCDLSSALQQDGGTANDAGTAQDSGHTCLPTGAACQYCPNGYLDDANGCATCQCKPPTSCGAVCAIYCPYGNVPDARGCPTCACNPPPTGPCSTAECGPAPGAPSQLCSDGKTVAGPICLRDQTGACGWRLTTCPEPTPCPCATGQLCVTQIGGPAIPNPPPSQCEVPDPTCVQMIKTGGVVVSPCVCLSASDGRCGQGDDVGSCTCDNGIR